MDVDGVLVTFNIVLSSTNKLLDDGMLIESGTLGLTLTVQVAESPLSLLTVITVVPALLAETFPDESTEATLLLLLDHVYSAKASDGVVLTVKVVLSPSTSDLEEGRLMDVGGLEITLNEYSSPYNISERLLQPVLKSYSE